MRECQRWFSANMPLKVHEKNANIALVQRENFRRVERSLLACEVAAPE